MNLKGTDMARTAVLVAILLVHAVPGCRQSPAVTEVADEAPAKATREESTDIAVFPEEITPSPAQAIPQDTWTAVSKGLWIGAFSPTREYPNGQEVRRALDVDQPLLAVRIDPAVHAFRLLCESEVADGTLRSVEEWSRDFGLMAAVNAGMFRQDYKTNTGLMVNHDHVNNPKLTPDYKAVFAFNRKDEGVPPAQIIDLQHQDFDALRGRYHTLIQGLRMISSKQTNVWSQSDRIWSTAVLAMDRSGRVLLLHCRAPYSVHDLNDILLSLPQLDVFNAMYLEGGPEASLYLQTGDHTIRRMGSYETGFNEDDDEVDFWPLPNVIGVVKGTGATTGTPGKGVESP